MKNLRIYISSFYKWLCALFVGPCSLRSIKYCEKICYIIILIFFFLSVSRKLLVFMWSITVAFVLEILLGFKIIGKSLKRMVYILAFKFALTCGHVDLKLVSTIFQQIFIYHQVIALQKHWKMIFISSKKLFSFSRYLFFCVSMFPSFSPCHPLL